MLSLVATLTNMGHLRYPHPPQHTDRTGKPRCYGRSIVGYSCSLALDIRMAASRGKKKVPKKPPNFKLPNDAQREEFTSDLQIVWEKWKDLKV